MYFRRTIWVMVAAASFAPSIGFAQRSDSSGTGPVTAGKAPTSDTQHGLVLVIGASTGLGLSYLPLTIMEKNKLLEKHAAALGFNATLQVKHYPTAAPMYDDLLSGKIGFAGGGVTQLLTSWDKTHADPILEVKGIATLNAMPLYLVTSNTKVKTVADFTSKDKIAVVAVRTSIEAVMLSMAAEKAFGSGQTNKLDPLTVAMGHPEAMKDLLNGESNIDAHIASSPYMYEELAKPGIHKVLDSYEVLGGPHTHNLVWTTTKFHDTNPKLVEAFVAALQEALDLIKSDPARAAAIDLKTGNDKSLSAAQIEEIIRKPENHWTEIPLRIRDFATFMYRTGLISTMPLDSHELFFNDVKNLPGN
ncbi:ABC transporter substrate-binding protein [Acidisarcina polymorpha]|uniref:ABC transporter substrate-binding protein n=1 Tax=Acidisarcina polymorpha TaxID=2211140 RepID=UPI0013750A41|nr:ABC transporter substrate-binding protein [Acidisarcina polymorpha]